MGYKLIRGGDGLKKESEDIMYIDFDDTGRFKEKHDKPKVGYSLLISPFNIFYTLQTTVITEILEETDELVHFKTKNSEYKLFKTKKAE
jgi:hypothetical protein